MLVCLVAENLPRYFALASTTLERNDPSDDDGDIGREERPVLSERSLAMAITELSREGDEAVLQGLLCVHPYFLSGSSPIISIGVEPSVKN